MAPARQKLHAENNQLRAQLEELRAEAERIEQELQTTRGQWWGWLYRMVYRNLGDDIAICPLGPLHDMQELERQLREYDDLRSRMGDDVKEGL